MSLTYQKKTSLALGLIVTIFLSVIGLLLFLLLRLSPIVRLVVTNQGSAPCDCASHVAYLTSHPVVGSLVMLFAIAAVVFLLYIVFMFIVGFFRTKSFIRSATADIVKFSSKLSDITRSINLSGKVVEVQSNTSEVFCYGFFKPKICVSSRLVRGVSKNQLRAILLHEKNHLASRDPLKIFIVNTIRKCLLFLPGLRKLMNRFEIGLELSADEHATNHFKEVRSLGTALIKIAEDHNSQYSDLSPQTQDTAVTFLGVTEARIDRLLSTSSASKFAMFRPKIIVSFLLILGLFFTIYSGNVLLANASHMDGMGESLTCYVMPEMLESSYIQESSCGTSTMMSCSSSSAEVNYCY